MCMFPKPYSEREFSCDYPGCKTKCVYESAMAHHKRVRHGDGFMCDHCGKRLASPGSRNAIHCYREIHNGDMILLYGVISNIWRFFGSIWHLKWVQALAILP